MRVCQPIVFRVLLLIGTLALYQCNRVSDLQPHEEPVPDAVVQMIPDRFPGATGVVIRTVEKDSLWEATYTLDGEQYYAGLDANTVRYRAQIMGSAVPDEVRSIISGSAIGGGEFGDFKRDLTVPASYAFMLPVNYTRYLFNNVAYRLEWNSSANGQTQVRYSFSLAPYSKMRYPLVSSIYNVYLPEKTPGKIKRYLADRHLDLRTAMVHVDETNRKAYQVEGVSLASIYQLRFNKDLALESTTYSPELIFYSREELPDEIIRGIGRITFLNGFAFVSGRKYITDNGPIYALHLKNGAEKFEIEFSTEGNLIYLKYSGDYLQKLL